MREGEDGREREADGGDGKREGVGGWEALLWAHI